MGCVVSVLCEGCVRWQGCCVVKELTLPCRRKCESQIQIVTKYIEDYFLRRGE